jgi:hypothetical protein
LPLAARPIAGGRNGAFVGVRTAVLGSDRPRGRRSRKRYRWPDIIRFGAFSKVGEAAAERPLRRLSRERSRRRPPYGATASWPSNPVRVSTSAASTKSTTGSRSSSAGRSVRGWRSSTLASLIREHAGSVRLGRGRYRIRGRAYRVGCTGAGSDLSRDEVNIGLVDRGTVTNPLSPPLGPRRSLNAEVLELSKLFRRPPRHP